MPVRDDAGKLCEVRFYKDSQAQEPLAVIGISDEGALPPLAQVAVRRRAVVSTR